MRPAGRRRSRWARIRPSTAWSAGARRERWAGAPRGPAAISVGTNPTFDGVERRVEAYVLDRDDLELYDVEVAIDFYARLRGQVKYAGKEAVIKQMHADVEEARHLLHAA